MSRFINKRYKDFDSYKAGEQPLAGGYIKLNTNENPFPPSPKVKAALNSFDVDGLRLYEDPKCTVLRKKLAWNLGIEPDNVMPTNGSDDVLNYAVMAFGVSREMTKERPSFIFPDVTYSFYRTLCGLHGINYHEIPLRSDMTIDTDKYMDARTNVIIANPNAPTGISLKVSEIERIIKSNKDHVILIDEAYVDFGGESCVPLINKYDNLIVSRTFSKSRSFAGGRLGFAVADSALIEDLEKIRGSQSPYNVDAVTMTLGEAALSDDAYYRKNAEIVIENRGYMSSALIDLGFTVLPSSANFLFVKHPVIKGADLYEELKMRGILVRHFSERRIRDYIRITVGTKDEIDRLIYEISLILPVKGKRK